MSFAAATINPFTVTERLYILNNILLLSYFGLLLRIIATENALPRKRKEDTISIKQKLMIGIICNERGLCHLNT